MAFFLKKGNHSVDLAFIHPHTYTQPNYIIITINISPQYRRSRRRRFFYCLFSEKGKSFLRPHIHSSTDVHIAKLHNHNNSHILKIKKTKKVMMMQMKKKMTNNNNKHKNRNKKKNKNKKRKTNKNKKKTSKKTKNQNQKTIKGIGE